jgi:molecular chaperone Hsp33
MADMTETFSDQIMGFTLPGRNARGRAVRLEGVLDEVLSRTQCARARGAARRRAG